MADGRVKNGGARPGAGRKKRIVEDAAQRILFEEFNEEEERAAIRAMIAETKKGSVAAFNALMDRKRGKVVERRDDTGHYTIHIIDDDDPASETP